jgi:predicted lipoprotein
LLAGFSVLKIKMAKNINSKRVYLSWVAVAVVSTFTFLVSCNGEEEIDQAGFDRSAMLSAYATDLIIPNFQDLQASVNEFNAAVSNFNESQTVSNLEALQSSWAAAVRDFQHCSAFGFGPGSLPLGPFATVIGVFPVDETQVEANIQNPDFNLAASFDRDVRGFYAIEYLIFRENLTNEEVVGTFDAGRIDYLLTITAEVKTTVDAIVAAWEGPYLEEFTTNDGTSAGSPVSLMYNEFVKDYENLKNFKVELPAGLTAGQSSPNPRLVEAYYSGISTELIREHFESSKNIWYGRSRAGEDFTGFEEYLASTVGGPALIETTKAKIAEIDAAIAAIPAGELSDHVGSTEVQSLRDQLQSNTANFKSSMSSLLGISITFNSGDGD